MSTFRAITPHDWPPAVSMARSFRNEVSERIREHTDKMLSRVLDVAEFYRWRDNCDGTRTPFFILRKAIPGHAAGNVLALSELHAALRALQN